MFPAVFIQSFLRNSELLRCLVCREQPFLRWHARTPFTIEYATHFVVKESLFLFGLQRILGEVELMDIEQWKRKLEGGVPEEWCPEVHCDACDSSSPCRVIRVHRDPVTIFYAICVHCFIIKFEIGW